MAIEAGLTIIPVLNKIDLPAAEPERVAKEVGQLLGVDPNSIGKISGKTGEGVAELLDVFVKLLPNPTEGNPPPFLKGEGSQAKPIAVSHDADKHVLAHVFKVAIDPYVGRIAFARIHQGTLQVGCDRGTIGLRLGGDGWRRRISWMKPGDGLLAYDRNADGKANDGRELFGPQSGDGFGELAALDSDGNGAIDEGCSCEEGQTQDCFPGAPAEVEAFRQQASAQLARGERISELTVDERLSAERARRPGFVGLSFSTIAGFNANGAMPHYRATPESDRAIRPDECYLIDSGAQYRDGTTDITRVWPIGESSAAMKRDYTLVLGLVVLVAVFTVVFNLIVDIVYAMLDPRIRY